VRKKLIKNLGKKFQKTAGGGIFLTHNVVRLGLGRWNYVTWSKNLRCYMQNVQTCQLQHKPCTNQRLSNKHANQCKLGGHQKGL